MGSGTFSYYKSIGGFIMRTFSKILSLIIVSSFLLTGCGGYQIISETNNARPLGKFNNIHISWLELDPELWKPLGYDSKEQWVTEVNKMNLQAFQPRIKSNLSYKKITFDAQPDDTHPSTAEVIVKFKSAKAAQAGNLFSGVAADIDVIIVFIDLKSNAMIDSAVIKSTGKGSWNFETRLWNAGKHIADYIYDRLY